MGIRVQTQRGMRVLGHMVQRSHQIPQEVIGLALGICMLTIVKGAFFIGASVGRGVLIKRLSRHRWGAPSSVVMAGVGAGFQVGAEVIDVVLIILDQATMRYFDDEVQVRLGTDISVTVGPVGITEDILLQIQPEMGCLSYCSSMGAFVGVSLHGSILLQNHLANRAFYSGRRHRTKDILDGHVPLDGLAINVVQDLHVFLFDLEHGQHGDTTASIAPLPSHDIDEVASQRAAFEVREDDVKDGVRQRAEHEFQEAAAARADMRSGRSPPK